MRSSPPSRAWERPSSPADSQYSIDLGALELDSHSGASSPLPTQHVDKVLSEDVDGPSDFTQNMEAWMRGGTLKKGTLKGGLQSLKERKNEDGRPDMGPDRQTLKPAGSQADEDEQSASHHTPTNSPPKESIFESNERAREGEEESSDWDPYAEATTPQPPTDKHHHMLQPTVEEFYSELSPARAPSAPAPLSPPHEEAVAESAQPSPSKSERSTPGRPSSDTISPTRSPVFSRASARQYSSQTDEASSERQLEQLRIRCRQLEHLNATLSQAVDEERRIRKEESAAHASQMADVARRERDLTEMKDQAYLHEEDFRKEFAALKERAQSHDKQQEDSRRELERLKREQAAEVRKLKGQMERKDSEHEEEVRALEEDLELAHRGRDEAVQDARVAREELAAVKDKDVQNEDNNDEDDDLDRMQAELDQDGETKSAIAEMEEQLGAAIALRGKLKDKSEATRNAIRNFVRTEVVRLQQPYDDAVARLTEEAQISTNLAKDLQKQLWELLEELKNEREAHEAELEQLLAERREAQPALPNELGKMRTELNEAILERDDAQDSLEGLQAELDATKVKLADLEAVNETLDAKVSDAIRRREMYWRGRLDEAEKERRTMVKTLMQQWGRQELGVEEPQRYEYKFVGLKSDAKAGA